MEVLKTRLQLDGELQGKAHLKPAAAGAAAVKIPDAHASSVAGPSGKVYNGTFDCLGKTWKSEGIKGVQRGLGAAVRCLAPSQITAPDYPLTCLSAPL